ncbi:MAG: translesion error-prone DNA polymerase V autoproteolytic subunit [Desulfobacterales bacterium]|nr:translesion error-prone DNA polymerase V autoproteolytic subunit [Desulfobacterales bacterium]MCP4161753.1 translesion error-prone DNA polymerase V autoproteolytic subunit [Deltaproteobacteria bacterium]
MVKVKSIYRSDQSTECKRPVFMMPVSAGFPSPADSYIEGKLDLNKHLIKKPVATFFVKVSGDSMTGAGIFSDDLLIVDRSMEPVDKKVVIAVVDGELTVKRIRFKEGRVSLVPENENYAPIEFSDNSEVEIWGVVTYVIHPL